MRQVILDRWVKFTEPFEGIVETMYLDEIGKVTVGLGELIDDGTGTTPENALDMPFIRFADGTPATRTEIITEWLRVKHGKDFARLGWMEAAKGATIHLTRTSILELVFAKLREMNAHLLHRFPAFEGWCADAQLGALSMAWAAGPSFVAPHFDHYARAFDFKGCAAECRLHTARDGVNILLFENAARITEQGLDPAELYWPSDASLTDETEPTEGESVT